MKTFAIICAAPVALFIIAVCTVGATIETLITGQEFIFPGIGKTARINIPQ